MIRTVKTFSLTNLPEFKERLLIWAQQFETAIWLDSNNYKQNYSSFNSALAFDEFTSIKTDFVNAFQKLNEYQSSTKDYIFGYISYDVKNDVEKLSSSNFDGLNFSDLYFFQPKKIIFIRDNIIEFKYLRMIEDDIEIDFESILNIKSNNSEVLNSEKNIKKIKI